MMNVDLNVQLVLRRSEKVTEESGSVYTTFAIFTAVYFSSDIVSKGLLTALNLIYGFDVVSKLKEFCYREGVGEIVKKLGPTFSEEEVEEAVREDCCFEDYVQTVDYAIHLRDFLRAVIENMDEEERKGGVTLTSIDCIYLKFLTHPPNKFFKGVCYYLMEGNHGGGEDDGDGPRRRGVFMGRFGKGLGGKTNEEEALHLALLSVVQNLEKLEDSEGEVEEDDDDAPHLEISITRTFDEHGRERTGVSAAMKDNLKNSYPHIFQEAVERGFISPEGKTEGVSKKGDGKGHPKSLEKYCVNLVEAARRGEFDPLVGRVEELERTIQVLTRRRKNNPIFVGEAGVGKTAIAFELARRIALGEVPESLKDSVVYAFDTGDMVAGTRYRGDFEQRIQAIMKDLLDRPQYILFIDEIHTIWGAGSSTDSSLDLANMLKPHLSMGRIRCIGATTYEDFRLTLEKDRALTRRFQKIDISEPTLEQTVKILSGLKSNYEEFHKVEYTPAAIEAAVHLSDLHIDHPPNPDKSIDVIDEAGSLYRAFPERYSSNIIDEEEVRAVVSKIARIPDIDLFSDEKLMLKNLGNDLKGKVFGQEGAVDAVVSSVKLGRAGLKRKDRPIASFLFAGPTGVGKTELARQLANALHIEFIRFDMSECTERHSVARLIGADPGYIGYEAGGQLTNAVKKHPHCVLLLDEIEKAHPSIHNLLLQVMDAARLTDNFGREINFRNVILIMTSNVGADSFDRGRVGFEREALNNWDEKALNRVFPPEFRNRFDAIVNFAPLPKEVVLLVVDKFIKEMEFQLADRKVTFDIDPEVKVYFADKGYDPKLGARPLDRLIQKELKAKLADEILFGALEKGGDVKVSLKEGSVHLDIVPRQE